MDLIPRFLDHLRDERGLSPRTREAYARDLEKFADEVGRLDAAAPGDVSEHDVRRFIARLHRQGLGARSTQRVLSAVRSLYRYLVREGIADHNPASAVKAPKAPKKLPKTLDTDAATLLKY